MAKPRIYRSLFYLLTNISLNVSFSFTTGKTKIERSVFPPRNNSIMTLLGGILLFFSPLSAAAVAAVCIPRSFASPLHLWAFLRFDSSSKTDTIDKKKTRLLNPLSSFHQVIAQQRANNFATFSPIYHLVRFWNLRFGWRVVVAVVVVLCVYFFPLCLSFLVMTSSSKKFFFFGSPRGVSFFSSPIETFKP